MLKYGENIVTRKDSEGKDYETTVIEEIMAHFDEDGYEIQSELNKKIIAENTLGH